MFMQGIGKLRSPLASGSWVLASGEFISQKKPGHVHTNWLFGKPGTYTMKVRLRGVPVKVIDGKAVVSEPVRYTWVVGGRSGSQSSAVVSARRDRTRQNCSLHTVIPSQYQWYPYAFESTTSGGWATIRCCLR